MLIGLARKWWVLLLNGICAIVFGLTAFTWPGMTLLTLTIVYGLYCIAEGVASIIVSVTRGKRGESWGVMLFRGVISLIAGGVALFWPAMTAIALLVLIAVWAIVRGIFEIIAAIRLRQIINNEWLLVLGGIISVLFGAFIMARPGSGALSLIWIIGAFAIAHGILLIALSLKLHKLATIAHRVTL
jgi:uncharacterized membrane protein HdeD (DUF308 family)